MNNKNNLTFYRINRSTKTSIPFFEIGVKAGFPSPAEEYEERPIDLNKELIKNPPSTFFCRVDGVSMQDFGIDDGDLLVVDRSMEPHNGKIAVCYIDGEFTLKKIKIDRNHCWLLPGNKNYTPIKVTEENEFLIWGIVIHSIKSF
ncbi:LexA family protein [Salibacter halophilus]|uniref:Translesion error-prone DNA polymerase V autoproteolytic subunit n=1 Tax=Salibacter halophilus TaxID=1803916 RepID=A0A6N6M8J3_9FLAO|nr:translesion error-prone DNA polymerase V autoproteolytic subunit [Salibacter halophilus]KAB1065074.1 translesion error-prone DNA polymerase V autoproteolytic subunit [Salibacter halophilus]